MEKLRNLETHGQTVEEQVQLERTRLTTMFGLELNHSLDITGADILDDIEIKKIEIDARLENLSKQMDVDQRSIAGLRQQLHEVEGRFRVMESDLRTIEDERDQLQALLDTKGTTLNVVI